ncbi:MAG: permease [Chloroflexaceae bacterium]
MLHKPLTVGYKRLMPIATLVILALIVGQALFQSLSAWLSGAELKNMVPVFEAPIASAGKALGVALTAWIPAWSIPTPVGPIDVQKTVACIIYEWFKLPIILFLTTFGMTLLRLRVGTRWIKRTLGRNDLIGAAGGALLGMFTPVCSCTVTNLYAGIVAGGASRRASAAFLFASPALNEFAIILMFVITGPLGGSIYLLAGIVGALITACAAPLLGLTPERFVGDAIRLQPTNQVQPESVLVRAHRETCHLFKRLFGVVLLSGLLAGVLINFNLTLVASLQQAGAAWWGPLVATVIGLSLDINAASMAPILVALVDIVPTGTLVATMMTTTVSSIPEWAMLNKLIGRWSTIKVVGWFATYVTLLGLGLNAIFAR